jgi:hypothetical protein
VKKIFPTYQVISPSGMPLSELFEDFNLAEHVLSGHEKGAFIETVNHDLYLNLDHAQNKIILLAPTCATFYSNFNGSVDCIPVTVLFKVVVNLNGPSTVGLADYVGRAWISEVLQTVAEEETESIVKAVTGAGDKWLEEMKV